MSVPLCTLLAVTPDYCCLTGWSLDENRSAVVCNLCGEVFTLPEDEVDGNSPRVLLCGHIYCTSCLRQIQCDNIIKCPECEVESTLPEAGVDGLQEDSRIVGLLYTAKMRKIKSLRWDKTKNRRRAKLSLPEDNTGNTEDMMQPADIEKIEKELDEALVQAAESLAMLEYIQETLSVGLAEQRERERARLEKEVRQVAAKAVNASHKWRDVQLSHLAKLEAPFSTSKAELCRVEERLKALKTAMQIGREIRRIPFLGQYCTLDKVLETLQAPVDNLSFNMNCITAGSGVSYVFQLDGLNQNVTMSLKMDNISPKDLTPQDNLQGIPNRKSPRQYVDQRNSKSVPPNGNMSPNPPKLGQESPVANSPSTVGSSPHCRSSLFLHCSDSDHKAPDVIIEELLDEVQEQVVPPTGPELANDKWRVQKRRKNQLSGSKRKVTHWVVVTHIVNPNHFYVTYMTEKKESEILSKKINRLCCRKNCLFTSNDTVETGSMIFVMWQESVWCRANVVQVLQSGCVEAVKACSVTLLASVRVFCLDYGLSKSISIDSEDRTTDSLLRAVNKHLRKVDAAVKVEMCHFTPQAIRCSLKDLVPYDLTKGWSKEARSEFCSVVGTSAVEMWPLGQDRDSLLVDLKKAPMDQSSDMPISVREYLVFIEVARFYSPVTLGRRPLLYYPPVYPTTNRELNAVVSHINSPADFFIQLVDNMESLLLSAKLQDCYSPANVPGEEDFKIHCPVIGQACVARYDNLWYRAQVIGHPGGRKVEVLYVDFGNKNILSVSDLRKIKDEFFALPSLAIHCCLSEVIPLHGGSWSEACIDRFISLAHQKLVTIVATARAAKTEPLPVNLFESGLDGPLANIAELLVKDGLASFKPRLKSKHVSTSVDHSAIWDPPLELNALPEGIDSPDPKIPREQHEEPQELQLQINPPVQLSDLKVRVSHVNSPSSFYVQLTQYNCHLNRICELVKKECELTEPQDVVWKADMFCAARIKGIWQRGRICSDVTSSNIAEVMCCDQGNKVKLHVSNLRPLPTSLMGSLALECTLTDIRPAGGQSTWTATACDLFSNYLTGASALVTIKEWTDKRPLPVTLFCANKIGQFVSIADFLASEGLALRERKPRGPVTQEPKETDAKSSVCKTQATGSDGEPKNTPHPVPSLIACPTSSYPTPIPPKPAPRTIMSPEKVKTRLYHPPELPCLGHIQISVSAIGDDGLIYTRTHSAECQLEQLRERIQQSMKTLPRQKPYTWKSVLGCAVIGPDMLWYRGQLMEVLGGHVKVQYVDYGLIENIPVVHVYPVLLCEDVPQLCTPCQLHGINPVGGKWQRDAVALMREMLLNRCVDMQVVELPSDSRGSLTVEFFLDGLSLSRILCHHEHGSMDQTVRVLEVPGDSVAPSTPFLDVWDIDIEGLGGPEELMLGPFISPNLPQQGEKFQVRVKHLWTPNELFLWPLEGPADVEVDGETLDEALAKINTSSLSRLTDIHPVQRWKYYRAKLIKFTSVEPVMILVQHVDFGSDDILPTSKLRQIPAELLRFPAEVFKVRVAGFKPPSFPTQENVLPYSPAWSVKAALDMIDLLHGNITASVVAQTPELTVLLYNDDEELVHLPLVLSGLADLE
ncbi:hypothetical protein Q5P01_013880 [Channa striata]|uniref:Ring finger protein 17 n=1 Tax=Channa striata TaxID=64152 RepID=A0AA88MNQ9_CHASR|nr:hypothetical protein Q5P01_013880 [Channa striata]